MRPGPALEMGNKERRRFGGRELKMKNEVAMRREMKKYLTFRRIWALGAALRKREKAD